MEKLVVRGVDEAIGQLQVMVGISRAPWISRCVGVALTVHAAGARAWPRSWWPQMAGGSADRTVRSSGACATDMADRGFRAQQQRLAPLGVKLCC